MNHAITVIVPTLNESESIGGLLGVLKDADQLLTIIVVDGGSTDNTVEIAESHNVKVIHASPGRGSQMHAGALIAEGEVFWFIHADTIPPLAAVSEMRFALKDPRVAAGNFSVRFEGRSIASQFLTWLYPQLRRLGLIYGDSAIFVRRDVYERVSGFRPFPIFEDVDLIRRVKKEGEIVTLPATLVTSSRRFEKRSFALTFIRWMFLQLLYWVGVSPTFLGRMYHPRRRT